MKLNRTGPEIRGKGYDGMAETTETYTKKTVCTSELCPDLLNPGKVGCKVAEIAAEVSDLKLALNGPPGKPEEGFIHQGLNFFDGVKKDAQRRKDAWKNKLAVAAILAVLVVPPASYYGVMVTSFVSDLYQIVQDWHQIHKTEIDQKKITAPKTTGEVTNARNQQFAGKEW